MTNLRDLAKGQQCQIRIPMVCNGDPATTVLAHFRLAGTCGAGQKPPDTNGAWACSSCHDKVDFRNRDNDWPMMRQYHLEGVIRTLHELSRLGYKMKK